MASIPASGAARPPVPPIRIDFSAEDRRWITERIDEVLANGQLTLGKYGAEFEAEFARQAGAKHAIAVNSGTSSLEIILRVLKVEGRDVLVPADTFMATATAVIAAGGNPILMDSDVRTMSTTPEEILRKLTPNTAGIMIVHIAGIVTDAMPAIAQLAKDKDLWLVEDAAHAHASRLDGKHAGTFGIAGSFSFYPTKVMTSAEGGMIVTDDDDLASEARIYRDQGKASFHQNLHVRIGSNWRMSEPHAIIGLRHHAHLEQMVADRRKWAARYDAAFAAQDFGVTPIAPPANCHANYYKYPVMLRDGVDRAALKQWLRESHGVICAGEVYEKPLHQHPALAHLATAGLEQAEYLCARHICLPMFASMTAEEVDRVLEALADAKAKGML
ncbi:MAG: DegT/DnrJ/EryC1/StrS family aminotransferase [Proteobacteria bacterium]|nr:DegT/DnrJ/EryC1/StrS family aminotransferase [Pseudomonadota bacterium]